MAIWQGECLKCNTAFQHLEQTEENPSPSGTFCPECKAKGWLVVGVIHWEKYYDAARETEIILTHYPNDPIMAKLVARLGRFELMFLAEEISKLPPAAHGP